MNRSRPPLPRPPRSARAGATTPGVLALLAAALALALLLAFLLLRRPGRPEPADPGAARTTGSGAARTASSPQPASSRRMAALLARIAHELDPAENPYLNRRRAELYRAQLRDAAAAAGRLDALDAIDLRMRLGVELLHAGDSEAADAEFARVGEESAGLPPPQARTFRWLSRFFRGLAHLRLAEQENCVAHHTSHSCLFPILEPGRHGIPRGARGAVEHLGAALEQNPGDIAAIWLLNIAYMALGEYPAGVPEAWRIDSRVFRSEAEFPRFRDVAPCAGLAAVGLSGGSVVEDLDGDGRLDVMASSWGLADPLRVFRNAGNGRFVEITARCGLEGITGGLNLVHADPDNDGDADVLVLRGAWMGSQGRLPNSLLRNDGRGRFTDVTEEAGLLSLRPTQTAAWADYDGDGWLDLFVGNESDERAAFPCELYHNHGDGTFTECAARCGVAIEGFVKAVAWGDYDNDGRPDLYISRLDEPNILLRNAGPGDAPEGGGRLVGSRDPPRRRPAAPVRAWRFEDRSAEAGVAEPLRSFASWFFDYDNDGWLDLFTASYEWEDSMRKVAAGTLSPRRGGGGGGDSGGDSGGDRRSWPRPRLYHNEADGTFADVTEEVGLDRVIVAMGANFGDANGDGYLDIYLGTGEPDLAALMPNRLFRCREGERFEDVTTAAGVGHLQKGHGVSFADIDGDGDQDIFTVLGGAYEGDVFANALFENPGTGASWVTLELEGVEANRAAQGARVELVVVSGRRQREIHRVVGTGGSFGSSSLALEVGLGDATSIRELRVRWPGSDRRQTLRNLPINCALRVREGEGSVRVLERRPARLCPHEEPASGRRGG